MNALARAIEKITMRRRKRAQDVRQNINRLRRAITNKSGKWEGTHIIRETRDASKNLGVT